MAENTIFESRKGELKCPPERAFSFLTDIRNFRQFIPDGSVTEVVLEKESCSFRIDMLGSVSLFIADKTEFSMVVYKGTIPQIRDFSISVQVSDKGSGKCDATIIVQAEFNSFLKMFIAKPLKKALEQIISTMENFSGW